ncbi:heterotrimeric G protein beta subunit 1 [Thalassiosira pseudonana CCMP1335]|uniref:Heterotrimeric G protein beta subunit 1 n=1 Tax=Thalassiosira pseudonana TaxID=35128 RepID=B8BZX6_THAPS|nr:heterotrimeric G protein beta subunit 1 [Thalassiosira pseudonana CCMP1335]EED93422.1 heterotrimeric G protein beta subunit 1 [Thalassiosira pseudonana CCMP1335]
MARQSKKKAPQPKEGPSSSENDDASASSDGIEEGSSSNNEKEQDDADLQSKGSNSDSGNSESDNDVGNNMELESPTKEQAETMEEDDDEEMDDGSSSDDEQEANNNTPAASAPPPISKSWTTLTTHSPCYTGGTVAFSHSPTSINSIANTNITNSGETPHHEQQHFILAQRGGDVSIIEASTGLLVRTIHDEESMDAEAITAFALSPNNKEVVVVTRGHLVRRYSLVDGVVSISFGKSGHTLPVTNVAFHESGIFFATGSVEGLVKVWDGRNGFATHALYPTSSGGASSKGRYAVTCLQWKPTATSLILAIGREDGSVSIHDLLLNTHDSKKASLPVAVMRDHVSAVTCVAWSEGVGGGLFFSSGRDSVINTWLSTKVTYLRIRTLPVYEQVESMILLSRRFRPVSETKEQQEVLDRKDVVLATCGTKGIIRLWKASPTGKEGAHSISDLSPLASQSEQDAFGEENGGYTSLHLTSLSTTHLSPLLVAVDAEHNMTFVKIGWKDSGLGFSTDRTIVGHNGEILDLAVIPPGTSPNTNDKHTIAVATNSSQVRIFGLADAKKDELGMLDGHSAIVLAIDASPCGRYLATAGKDKTMRVWHIASQKCVGVATGHTEAVGSVALSNKIGSGAFVVTASKDRTLKVWPLAGSATMNKAARSGDELTLRARLSARAHEKDINIVSVAPNDSLIATGSQDKTVKLWRSTDLALHGTLKGHKRGVWDCQFSPHDRVLVTASGDKTVKLWSIADCSCVRTFQGHMAGVLRVRFLTTGLQLVSSGSDGLVKLWTIRTNECESTIDAHDDKIWALDLSPCGTALFSGGADSKIAVWRDTTKERDDASREAEEQNIFMEQKLSNHLRHKQYEEALEIALELDKPHQVLRVLTEIVEKDTKSNRGVETLQKHAVKWPLNRLTQILRYCREWNTRARNSHVAMLVVKAVVTTIPAAKLASYEGIPEILAGIAPYAERHFDRLDGMVGNSYLLDFSLFSMGSLHGDNDETYGNWLDRSRYVLPPKVIDGRIQVGGSLVVGAKQDKDSDDDSSSDSSVVTIGDSDTSDDDSDSN